MSLSSYLFQQNQMQQPISALTPKKQNIFDAYSQQIAPKELAGMETRTPTQIAYDNMLNREYEINQQNKRNNFVSGLMSGIGGLGKVIANSVVSNPYQKAGAMEGIGEQETRLDGLRQAYDQARQQQNKDYVNQAREQLGLAREDEDKNWNRDLTKEQIAYKKMIDDRNYKNQIKQQELENELKNKEYALKEIIEKNNQENFNKQFEANQNNANRQYLLEKEKLGFQKENAKNQMNAKSNEEAIKQYQESMKNIDNAKSKISKLTQAQQLNKETPNSSVENIFKLGLNPLAKVPGNDRMSPLYQALTTETDPKKAEMELLKYGISKDMSPEDLDRNVNRLIEDNRNEIIREYSKLGYKIQKDDETGAIRVVDTKGNIIEEF